MYLTARRWPPRGGRRAREGSFMQSSSWAVEHSEALREQIVRGRSYGEAVDAINAKFGTAYTRCAAISRGKRMGLVIPARPDNPSMLVPRAPARPRKPKLSKTLKRSKTGAVKAAEHRADEADPAAPAIQTPEPLKLRCVGIRPRLVSLVGLEDGECRYPYGGDQEGEAISFCAHPCFRGSSYCGPHFHLTRAPADESERPPGPFVLRLVQAA
jgi:GcrA cell cycle regulator